MSGPSKALRLFVGNLPWTVSRKELSEYFSQFGVLRSATVVFSNQTGMSRGYGFVEFAQNEGYTNAISQDQHVLEKSKLTLGATYPGRQPSSAANEG